MKNYLMVVGLALAMIGCAHNRGGVADESERQTGYDNNFKMPKSSEYNRSSETNNVNSDNTLDRIQPSETPPDSTRRDNTAPQN